MVAYSFKPRFIAAILAGTKKQTLRAYRARHARPGDNLQLYTGMRTKHCRLIGRARCSRFMGIELHFGAARLHAREVPATVSPTVTAIYLDHISDGGCWSFAERVDPVAFALADGFSDVTDMMNFWREEHDVKNYWQGFLIGWDHLEPDPLEDGPRP